MNTTVEVAHGTIKGYVNQHCRCRPCTDAMARYCQGRRLERKRLGICADCSKKAVPGRARCREHQIRTNGYAHKTAKHERMLRAFREGC